MPSASELKEVKAATASSSRLRERIVSDLKKHKSDLRRHTQELIQFSAAIDKKAAKKLETSDKDIGARPLTRGEQVKAARMSDELRDMIRSAERLVKVIERELDNLSKLRRNGVKSSKLSSSKSALEKSKSEAKNLIVKAETSLRILKRARTRDDLKTILLKSAGIGAVLAVSSTLIGTITVGGIVGIASLVAFGVSRILEEIEKIGED